MLAVVGYDSLDAFIDAVIPQSIRLHKPLAIPANGASTKRWPMRRMAARNQVFRSYIGMGYYDTHHARRSSSATSSRTPAGTRPTRPTRPRSRRAASRRCSTSRRWSCDLTGLRDRQRLAARRGHGRRRGDDDVARGSRAATSEHRVLRLATPATRRRSTSSRPAPQPLGIEVVVGDHRDASTFDGDGLRRRSSSIRRPTARSHDYRAFFERAHAARRAASSWPPTCSRSRCSRRRASSAPTSPSAPRSASACRWATAARTRRSSRRKDEYKRQMPGRLVGVSQRRARQPRAAPGAADARAAHPPREGDDQHLHRAGAARRHGLHVRRLPRPRRAPRASRERVHRSPAMLAAGLQRARLRRRHDALLRHGPRRAAAARARERCVAARRCAADQPARTRRRRASASRSTRPRRATDVARRCSRCSTPSARRRRRRRRARARQWTTRSAERFAPHERVPHAPGLQHATTPRPRCCATSGSSRRATSRSRTR